MAAFEDGESYYQKLGIPFWASAQDVRQAYRRMSKRYHPDTTALDPLVAVQRFQDIQQAYIVLTNPTQKTQYDAWLKARYVRWQQDHPEEGRDPFGDGDILKTRPLSGTELFALLLMGGTLVACLALAGALAWVRQGSL